ncbi:MAG: hypothetical protein H8D65_01625 [Spirochaetes bacterium]|nr:hypothetical protein [Spirochaetota bacterium]MBL7006024.1 hypothetical protein [Spirochaetia bacterium]
MGILQGVLEDELQRLENTKTYYKALVSELPKGSLSIKKRANSWYVYRAFRDGSKVQFVYIGKKDSLLAQKVETQLLKRKQIEGQLKVVIKQISAVKRSLRAFK